MVRLRTSLVALVLALAAAPALAEDATYSIVMTRPGKVGDVRDVHIAYQRSATTTVTPLKADGPAPAPEVEKLGADIVGTQEVKEVTASGAEKVYTFTVKHFKDTESGKELLDAGTVVKITLNGKKDTTAVLKDGGEVAPEVMKIIESAFPGHPDGVTDDDVFGTREKQKVGGKWAVDAQMAAKDMDGERTQVAPENIKGEITLKSVDKAEGEDVMRLAGEMTMKDVKIGGLPDGFASDHSTMKMNMSGVFPLDASKPVFESKTEMEAHIVLSSAAANVDLVAHESRVETITLVKK